MPVKAGRNESCPCGSGKKYKRCCLDKDRQAESRKFAALNRGPYFDPEPEEGDLDFIELPSLKELALWSERDLANKFTEEALSGGEEILQSANVKLDRVSQNADGLDILLSLSQGPNRPASIRIWLAFEAAHDEF
jgi:hypothetical protein